MDDGTQTTLFSCCPRRVFVFHHVVCMMCVTQQSPPPTTQHPGPCACPPAPLADSISIRRWDRQVVAGNQCRAHHHHPAPCCRSMQCRLFASRCTHPRNRGSRYLRVFVRHTASRRAIAHIAGAQSSSELCAVFGPRHARDGCGGRFIGAVGPQPGPVHSRAAIHGARQQAQLCGAVGVSITKAAGVWIGKRQGVCLSHLVVTACGQRCSAFHSSTR